MTLNERAELIVHDIKMETETNPIRIFKNIAKKEYISIHGPEHHILDGACLLAAYRNAGGDIDLDTALEQLKKEGLKMPGAMCGLWGVCGAVTSIGAALAIIDGTGPLSADGTWGNHMKFTSAAIKELGKINGPRCCKRDAMVGLQYGIEYVNANYGVTLEKEEIKCIYSDSNAQCIKEKCPYYNKKKLKVAFICVHNSCRSQIAECLGRHFASDVFESYSAGTETKPQINQDAVRIMKELYGIDMEKNQYSKLLNEIPNPDIAISMGCNVSCPFIGREFDDNWGLEDPTGRSDDDFKLIIQEIEEKIFELKNVISKKF